MTQNFDAEFDAEKGHFLFGFLATIDHDFAYDWPSDFAPISDWILPPGCRDRSTEEYTKPEELVSTPVEFGLANGSRHSIENKVHVLANFEKRMPILWAQNGHKKWRI